MKAVLRALESGKYNGYAHTQGHEAARKAIAKYSAHQSDEEIKPENILMTSGCSSALEYCILALADSGQNILVPRPGFCLYHTLSQGLDIEVRYYDLLPDKQWQADLQQLEGLIDENTAALLINNPSNPCGSVFSKEHLTDLIAICEKYYLPIIADEIYEHFVFPGSNINFATKWACRGTYRNIYLDDLPQQSLLAGAYRSYCHYNTRAEHVVNDIDWIY